MMETQADIHNSEELELHLKAKCTYAQYQWKRKNKVYVRSVISDPLQNVHVSSFSSATPHHRVLRASGLSFFHVIVLKKQQTNPKRYVFLS